MTDRPDDPSTPPSSKPRLAYADGGTPAQPNQIRHSLVMFFAGAVAGSIVA